MPIISVEIMKRIDEKKNKNKNKNKRKINKDRKDKGNRSYSERVRAKRFYCAFKLGFLQLICKSSLIFNRIYSQPYQLFKQREFIVKACSGGVYMFKNMRLVILFDMLINPSFKTTTSFANIAKPRASTSKFMHQERFQIIRNCVFR